MKWIFAAIVIALAGVLGVLAFDPHMDAFCAVSRLRDHAADRHAQWQCIHYAAARGDRAAVRSGLDHGVRINLRTADGQTPLMLAARNGHLVIVRDLIARHAGLEARDARNGFTALHWAADRYHPAIVRALIAAGANVDAANKWEQTPLWQASWQADQGNTEIAHILIAGGANFRHADDHGNTPLLMAARAGHRPMIDYLLSLGADMAARNDRGQTPLYQAVAGHHAEAVRLLLARGADPDARVGGVAPLALALKADDPRIADLLQANGATGYRSFAATAALNKGRRAYTDGDYKNAIGLFGRAVELQPDRAEAYYRRGLARSALGETDEAAIDLREAITRDGSLQDAREALARLYVDNGDYAQAIDPLDRLIDAQPDNARALYLLGESQSGLGDPEQAGGYFSRACTLGFQPACAR